MTTSLDKQLWELIDNFFLKAALLICHSKGWKGAPAADEGPPTTNSWFNIETFGDTKLERELKPWTTFDGSESLPPLVIETYLDLARLSPSQQVTLKDQDGNPWNVCKGTKKSEIMLERWLIQLDNGEDSPSLQSPGSEDTDDNVSELYRQLVLLFRYLETLVGLLPASELQARLIRPGVSPEAPPPVKLGTRILDGSKPIVSKGRIGLSKSLIATYSNVINETNLPAHLEQRKITPIRTKFGSLRISVSYRKDCDFHVNGSEEYNTQFNQETRSRSAAPVATPSLRRVSMNSNRSMSISPNTTISPSPLAEPSPQKRGTVLARQLQPFKAGSVGSGSLPQVQQGSLSRNPSATSVAAALRAQRPSNGSITAPTSQLHESHLEPSSIGSGSLSKYSSSFGRLRRQSSVRRSDSVERSQKPSKLNESPSGDLLDFMKLLDDRKELKLKNKGTKVDISNSLLKFQGMRTTNNNLSTDLSMSMSLERPSVSQPRNRSNSHSPNSSFSPSIQYSSIPMRLSQSRSDSYRPEILDELSSARGSTERPKSIISNLNESFYDGRRLGGRTSSNEGYAEDEEDEEDLLVGRSAMNPASTNFRNRSTSPGSMRSVSSSFSKSQLPFKSLSNFSGPTTMATPAHAKLHKAIVGNSPETNVSDALPKKDDSLNQEEDDDLLFFMSDMNLSK